MSDVGNSVQPADPTEGSNESPTEPGDEGGAPVGRPRGDSLRKEVKVEELGLTEAQINGLRETFELFDQDGGGTITRRELAAALKRNTGTQPSMEEVDNMMKSVDTDGSGEIDFPEFCMLTAEALKDGQKDPDTELREAFGAFDKDKSGAISEEEIIFVLRSVNETVDADVLKELFMKVDSDKDGEINFEEFKQLMTAEQSGGT